MNLFICVIYFVWGLGPVTYFVYLFWNCLRFEDGIYFTIDVLYLSSVHAGEDATSTSLVESCIFFFGF